MATLKLALLPTKANKDGKNKIRIAISHKQDTCYIVTRFTVDSPSQFKNGQVVKRADASQMNVKLRNMLNDYQERLDGINNQGLYTCRQLKDILVNSSSIKGDVTFQYVSLEYVKELEDAGSIGYSKMIERLFFELSRSNFIKCFQTNVNFSYRRTRYLEIYKRMHFIFDNSFFYPFIDNCFRLSHQHTVCCLPYSRTVLEYVRKKTDTTTQGLKTISFTIHEEAHAIIKTWINKNTGRLDFGYKFSYQNFSRYVRRSLDALAKQLGITEKVVYYSARKSFAQYASEIGIPDGIIDYCLGHSDKSKGVIRYYTKVRQKQADMAIARVIDYVNNPDKYKDYIELRQDIMFLRG